MGRRKNNDVELIYSKRTQTTRIKINGVEIVKVRRVQTDTQTTTYSVDPFGPLKVVPIGRTMTIEFDNAKIKHRITR